MMMMRMRVAREEEFVSFSLSFSSFLSICRCRTMFYMNVESNERDTDMFFSSFLSSFSFLIFHPKKKNNNNNNKKKKEKKDEHGPTIRPAKESSPF